MSTAWIDASSGASGDMLLGALIGAGARLDVVQGAVDAVSPEPVRLRVEDVRRAAFAATRCHVEVADSHTHRTWTDVRALLQAADLVEPVRAKALATFSRLADAEGSVHGVPAVDIHFHEVGALDAVADVVGVCAALVDLGVAELGCSPVALGGGTVEVAHGRLGVPPPAVVELLRGLPSYGGPVELELCTPTGAALLAEHVTQWGPQPPMRVSATGVGAGGRDPDGHANVLRVLLGEATSAGSASEALVLEANIDDLDPRVWPQVIDALLAAGASDAWLTPILMKKGRPAHTLRVLTHATHADAVRHEVFRQTSTIGLREHAVTKHALDREQVGIEVDGRPISVKIARLDGAVVNAQPEYDDVRAAAEALDRPVRDVLAEATALARELQE